MDNAKIQVCQWKYFAEVEWKWRSLEIIEVRGQTVY